MVRCAFSGRLHRIDPPGHLLFPDVLDLRQFELFDPAIYGSSFVLSSLGDLLINSLLFTWIVVFINRRFDTSRINPYGEAWKNWMLLCVILTAQVIFTFTFAGIVQSLVADAQISFNVTNFFSLTQYSFIGFVILATLALSFSSYHSYCSPWQEGWWATGTISPLSLRDLSACCC